MPTSQSFARTRALLDELKLHTVCESAKCPNHWECWSKGTATFMIAGDRCTRACGFCAVTTAKPLALEADEPARVAEATRRMNLKHVVITAVARDDLPDGGAEHFRQTIENVRELNPGIVIEVLVPDFLDRDESIHSVLAGQSAYLQSQSGNRPAPDSRPCAIAPPTTVRCACWARSKQWRGDSIHTKSGLMLGLGETEAELFAGHGGFARARDATFSRWANICSRRLRHLPVVEFIPPEAFRAAQGRRREAMGFVHVASGPMVRSSYHADEFNPPAS